MCVHGGGWGRDGTNFTSTVTPTCVPSKPTLIKVFSQRTHSSGRLHTWHIKQKRKQPLQETPNYSEYFREIWKSYKMPDISGLGRWNGAGTPSVRWGPGHAATRAGSRAVQTAHATPHPPWLLWVLLWVAGSHRRQGSPAEQWWGLHLGLVNGCSGLLWGKTRFCPGDDKFL